MLGKISWYNLGGALRGYLDGGRVHLQNGGNTPNVATGVPQGGHAQPAINQYFAGQQGPLYSGDAAIGGGQVGAQQPVRNFTPTTTVPPAATTTTTAPLTGGSSSGQGSGPAATEQFVPATVTNQQSTYAGETYDTSQDTAGDNTAVGEVTTYTPEELAAITTDLSQSSLVDTDTRIADNTQYIDDVVSGGQVAGDVTVDPSLISAGPNILDASQTPDVYNQNFQENFDAQSAHSAANPTGMSTGVPIYEQGFDFSDAGIDALLPPTGEADPNAGSTAWGPLAGVENFLAGIGGKNVQDTRYGVTGNRTAQQQANVDAFQANPTDIGASTADRGSRSIRATRATEMAQATVDAQRQEDAAFAADAQAQLQAGVPAEEVRANMAAEQAALAEDRATQRLAYTFKADGHQAAERAAEAAGIDLSWQEIQDLGNTSHEYSQAGIDSIRAEQQGLNMGGPISQYGYNTGGGVDEEARRLIASSQVQQQQLGPKAPLQAGQVRSGQSPLAGIGMQLGKKVLGGALTAGLGPFGALLGGLFNEGGKVDDEETRKRISPARRALFNAQGQDIGSVAGDVIPGYNREAQPQAAQVDPFEGIAAKIQAAKAAGKPVDYNALAALQHARSTQNTEARNQAMRKFMDKYPEFAVPGGSQGVVLRNQGGPISANPHGYNEGGSTQATPIKKEMDMEKLEAQKRMDGLKMQQAEKSFLLAETRKDEAHDMAMKQKEEAHRAAMKLKKDSATMKAPLAK